MTLRYEHIDLNISTATCAELHDLIPETATNVELVNLRNNLRARLQRRDVDPQCPRNFPVSEEDWLAT